ncbi:serine/threonine-protein kinase RIPK-like [Lactuca sativa]|nr:serine/threonine-protein kinase RIPK-like [Lactuca sativa]
MKSANILLDDNMDTKICDFGLSRLDSTNQSDTGVVTKVAGTRFYMDPVCNKKSRLIKESDIYSFGVVMFEMSSGMMAYIPSRIEDSKEQYLIDIVRSYYDDHKFVDKLIDSAIKGQIDMSSFDKFNKIAHECISLDISLQMWIMFVKIRDLEIQLVNEASIFWILKVVWWMMKPFPGQCQTLIASQRSQGGGVRFSRDKHF